MLYGKANPLSLSSPSLQYRISPVGQEREEEEIQGLLLIEITQGFLEAWTWGPPSFIQGLKGLIFFSGRVRRGWVLS